MTAVRGRWLRGLLLAAVWFAAVAVAEPPLRFFAMGDVPYGESERVLLDALLRQALRKSPPFVVHVGDTKAGSDPCTQRALARAAEWFRSLPIPVVYTPGDNEWTDCRRPAAGGYDPNERLALLRRLYFADPSVLRLSSLGAQRSDEDYPENVRFLHRGVLFASAHVVGSDNNLNPDDASAAAEHRARSQANRRHLRRVAEVAKSGAASALVLLFHANPGFEAASVPRGFGSFREDLTRLLEAYPGPVLAVHGDTHRYRFDHPIRDPRAGGKLRRFARLEVPGSPVVAGVFVGVDPGADDPFNVELVYPDTHEAVLGE